MITFTSTRLMTDPPPQAGNHGVLELFLKKNPALVFARSHEDGSTPWHYAAQVYPHISPWTASRP